MKGGDQYFLCPILFLFIFLDFYIIWKIWVHIVILYFTKFSFHLNHRGTQTNIFGVQSYFCINSLIFISFGQSGCILSFYILPNLISTRNIEVPILYCITTAQTIICSNQEKFEKCWYVGRGTGRTTLVAQSYRFFF